jgi:hypothetical protein
MCQLNSWIQEYLPNVGIEPSMTLAGKQTSSASFFQKVCEFFLRNAFGKWLEKWEMKRKIARFTREQVSSFESYFSADVCKGHIDKHKQKTENAIEEKLERIVLRSTV